MMEKAPALGADLVFLDLEDSVAPDDKEQARKNVIYALNHYDWSGCSVSVRINGLDSSYCYRDIIDVAEQAGDKLRRRRRAARRVAVILDYSDGMRCARQLAAKPATANDLILFELARRTLRLAWTRRIRIRQEHVKRRYRVF